MFIVSRAWPLVRMLRRSYVPVFSRTMAWVRQSSTLSTSPEVKVLTSAESPWFRGKSLAPSRLPVKLTSNMVSQIAHFSSKPRKAQTLMLQSFVGAVVVAGAMNIFNYREAYNCSVQDIESLLMSDDMTSVADGIHDMDNVLHWMAADRVQATKLADSQQCVLKLIELSSGTSSFPFERFLSEDTSEVLVELCKYSPTLHKFLKAGMMESMWHGVRGGKSGVVVAPMLCKLVCNASPGLLWRLDVNTLRFDRIFKPKMLKQLESILSDVDVFDAPKVELEQYPTSPHIAARIVYTADSVYGDIEDRVVADLGCGGGILGIASEVMGAGHTIGVDVDADALEIARCNIDEIGIDMCFVHADMASLPLKANSVDTVVMNPPFGTRVKGVDVLFLEQAVRIAKNAVYSLHKSSTREFLLKKTEGWGAKCEVLAQLRFDIPKMYRFHKKREMDVEVDLLRLDVSKVVMD